jgi:hypothetical protein
VPRPAASSERYARAERLAGVRGCTVHHGHDRRLERDVTIAVLDEDQPGLFPERARAVAAEAAALGFEVYDATPPALVLRAISPSDAQHLVRRLDAVEEPAAPPAVPVDARTRPAVGIALRRAAAPTRTWRPPRPRPR